MSEPVVEALGLARSELAPRLNAITATDWEKATPSTEWNVRQLVNHIVGVHHRVARLICGGSREHYIATREDDWIGTDHAAAWHAGVRALDEAINTATSLDIPVAYRVPMSARDVVGVTAFDTSIHTWDVSRAIGHDEHLDHELVEFSLEFMHWLKREPHLSAYFQAYFPPPKGQLHAGASSQDRLIYLAGREP